MRGGVEYGHVIDRSTRNSPAPQTRIVVGADQGCTYNGLLYFPVTQLIYLTDQYQISAATLHLYTPNTTGPTGVLVYANAPGQMLPPPPAPAPQPGTFPAPTPVIGTKAISLPPQPAIQTGQQPTWNTAPAIAPSSSGISQSASAGHWQSWDVTTAARQWAAIRQTNTGLTLTGPASSIPVVFAASFAVGDDDPATAPYLDITLAPITARATGGSISPDVIPTPPPCDPYTCNYSDDATTPTA